MIVISEFCLLGVANAWIPPAGSPMAKGEHPRILFISDSHRVLNPDAPGFTLEEMRVQLSSSAYSGLFSSFISEVDAEYSKTVSSLSKMDITTNAINFAFLYKLDPDSWASSFSFRYTTVVYGEKAKEYGDYIALQAAAVISSDALKRNWSDYKTFNYGGGDKVGDGLTNVSMAVVADWCHDLFSKADKQAYMDGFIAIFNYSGSIDNGVFASAHHYGESQNCGGIFAFYGEELDDTGTKYGDAISAMGEKFESEWLIGVRDLHNLVYEDGANNAQGPSYGKIAANNMAPFISMMSSTLNENFFQTISYWRDQAKYKLYIIKPLFYEKEWHVLLSDDIGDNSQFVNMLYGKNELFWYPSIKHATGEGAQVAKWTKDTYYTDQNYKNLKWRGVLCYFFNGYENIVAKSPADAGFPLSTHVGMGQYVMRSGWGSQDDTLISFYAPKYHVNDGGHAHQDFASFKIFKYGNLTEDRQIAKSYKKAPSDRYQTQKSMFRNTIGVLDPAEINSKGYNLMGYRGGYNSEAIDPSDAAFHVGGANNCGVVKKDSLNSTHFDYIYYDYTNAWDAGKVNYAEREFVYLRTENGVDDEYVVVFDRVNAVNANHKKYYLLQSMFEPIVENAGDQISQKYPEATIDDGGRWVFPSSSAGSTVKMVNTYDNFHAAMFSRTLLPNNFQINKVGGPNHYWEDAVGTVIHGPASTTDELKNDYGTYTIQVQPTVDHNYDIFLNVMQIGDSNTLLSMTDTVGFTATTGSIGNLVGAHIKDMAKNRIALFNDQKSTGVPTQKAPYVYICDVTAHSFHLLTNIEPYAKYSVSTSVPDEVSEKKKIIAEPISSLDGVLSFSDTINSRGKIRYTIEKIDNAPAVLIIDQKDGMTVHSSPFMVTGSATVTNGNTVKGVSCMVNSVSYSADPVDGVWDSQCEKWTCKVPIASKQENNIMFEADDYDSSGRPITREFTVKRDNLCACP